MSGPLWKPDFPIGRVILENDIIIETLTGQKNVGSRSVTFITLKGKLGKLCKLVFP